MKLIYKFKSNNFNKRKSKHIKYIILHYTALLDVYESISYLCNPSKKVSSHFLINKFGQIYNLVDLKNRAWHAGESYWDGDIDINSLSIGIELDYCPSEKNKFSNKMIDSLNSLLLKLVKKYKISSNNILGHSDIAPYRKIDPGNKFPWNKLIINNRRSVRYKKNKFLTFSVLNKWFNKIKLKTKKTKVLFILGYIGYNTKPSIHNSKNFKILISAYQMRYNQKSIKGILDEKTYKLILKHFINKILNY